MSVGVLKNLSAGISDLAGQVQAQVKESAEQALDHSKSNDPSQSSAPSSDFFIAGNWSDLIERGEKHIAGVSAFFPAGANFIHHLFSSEILSPAEKVQELLKKKGVTDEQVMSAYYGPVNPDEEPSPKDYLHFACQNFSENYRELEKALGSLPLGPDGKLKAEWVEKLQTLQKQNLSDAMKEQLELVLNTDALPEVQLAAFFRIQALFHEQMAKALLASLGETGDPEPAQEQLQGYAEAMEKVAAFEPLSKDERRSTAQAFYQGGIRARKQEKDDLAQGFIHRGIRIIQEMEGVEQDPFALTMLAEGLQEIGEYKEALQVFDKAYVLGYPIQGLTNEQWFSRNQAFRKRLLASAAYCMRMEAALEKLGGNFSDRLRELQTKAGKTNLDLKECAELRNLRGGMELLQRVNALGLPDPLKMEDGHYQIPDYLKALEERIILFLKTPTGKKDLDALDKELKKMEAAEATLHAVEALRQEILKEYPVYVQEYVERSGDWSVVRLDYSDAEDLPEHWNREHLQEIPLLKGYRKLQEEEPKAAKKIQGVFSTISWRNLISDKIEAPEEFLAAVKHLEQEVLKVGKNPVTGEKTLEVMPELKALCFEAKQAQLDSDPEAWLKEGVKESQQELAALGSLLQAWEGQEGVAPEELQANTRNYYSAKVADLKVQVDRYLKHARALGKLEKNNQAPFQEELEEMVAKLEKWGGKVVPQEALQLLAGAQAQLSKAMLFTQRVVVKKIQAGEWDGVETKTRSKVYWVPNPEWEAEKENVEDELKVRGFCRLKTAEIDKVLARTQAYLKQTQEEFTQELPQQLEALINEQLTHWYQVAGQLDTHAENSQRAFQIVTLFQAAEQALQKGDSLGAWALYQKAIDSQAYQQASQDHQELLKNVQREELVITVGVTAVAGLIAFGTAGLLAPELVAAGSWGATALEGVLFYGAETAIHSGLYYGLEVGHNPLKDENGRWLDAGDHAFGVVQSIGALGAVKGSLKLFNRGFLKLGTAAQLGEDELLVLARQTGKAVEQLTKAEIVSARLARMGMMGKGIYHVGAFGTELGGLQVWNNMAATLNVLYQNLRHDKELAWGEAIAQTNSTDSLWHSVAFLAGLKLANGAIRPLHEAAGSRVQSKALQRKIQNFEKLGQAMEAKFKDVLTFDAKELAMVRRYVEMGDKIFLEASFFDGISPQARGDWIKARSTLVFEVALKEYDARIAKEKAKAEQEKAEFAHRAAKVLEEYDARIAREKTEAEQKTQAPVTDIDEGIVVVAVRELRRAAQYRPRHQEFVAAAKEAARREEITDEGLALAAADTLPGPPPSLLPAIPRGDFIDLAQKMAQSLTQGLRAKFGEARFDEKFEEAVQNFFDSLYHATPPGGERWIGKVSEEISDWMMRAYERALDGKDLPSLEKEAQSLLDSYYLSDVAYDLLKLVEEIQWRARPKMAEAKESSPFDLTRPALDRETSEAEARNQKNLKSAQRYLAEYGMEPWTQPLRELVAEINKIKKGIENPATPSEERGHLANKLSPLMTELEYELEASAVLLNEAASKAEAQIRDLIFENSLSLTGLSHRMREILKEEGVWNDFITFLKEGDPLLQKAPDKKIRRIAALYRRQVLAQKNPVTPLADGILKQILTGEIREEAARGETFAAEAREPGTLRVPEAEKKSLGDRFDDWVWDGLTGVANGLAGFVNRRFNFGKANHVLLALMAGVGGGGASSAQKGDAQYREIDALRLKLIHENPEYFEKRSADQLRKKAKQLKGEGKIQKARALELEAARREVLGETDECISADQFLKNPWLLKELSAEALEAQAQRLEGQSQRFWEEGNKEYSQERRAQAEAIRGLIPMARHAELEALRLEMEEAGTLKFSDEELRKRADAYREQARNAKEALSRAKHSKRADAIELELARRLKGKAPDTEGSDPHFAPLALMAGAQTLGSQGIDGETLALYGGLAAAVGVWIWGVRKLASYFRLLSLPSMEEHNKALDDFDRYSGPAKTVFFEGNFKCTERKELYPTYVNKMVTRGEGIFIDSIKHDEGYWFVIGLDFGNGLYRGFTIDLPTTDPKIIREVHQQIIEEVRWRRSTKGGIGHEDSKEIEESLNKFKLHMVRATLYGRAIRAALFGKVIGDLSKVPQMETEPDPSRVIILSEEGRLVAEALPPSDPLGEVPTDKSNQNGKKGNKDGSGPMGAAFSVPGLLLIPEALAHGGWYAAGAAVMLGLPVVSGIFGKLKGLFSKKTAPESPRLVNNGGPYRENPLPEEYRKMASLLKLNQMIREIEDPSQTVSPSAEVSRRNLEEVGEEHAKKFVKKLRGLLGAKDPIVQKRAIRVVVKLGIKEAVEELRVLVKGDMDDDFKVQPEVQREAARALARLKATEVIDDLGSLMGYSHLDPKLLGEIAQAMVSLGAREVAVEKLKLALWVPEPFSRESTRESAALALAKIGAIEASKDLGEILDDPTKTPRFRAIAALAMIRLGAHEKAIRSLSSWLDPENPYYSQQRALEFIDLCGLLGIDQMTPELRRIAREHADPGIRQTAGRVLDAFKKNPVD